MRRGVSKGQSKERPGLFCVGEKFACMATDQDIFTYLMDLLDNMYDGKASKHYVQHRIQTWFRVPHIRGAYTPSTESSPPVLHANHLTTRSTFCR